MKLKFKDLLTLKHDIRVHGNGFIQVDLPNGYRLHVWPDEKLQTQKVYTGYHNHNFGFESQILTGLLCHAQFQFVATPTGLYKLYRAEYTENEQTKLVLVDDQRYNVDSAQWFYLGQGSSYNFPPVKFHDSSGIGLTATLMKKTHKIDIKPIVACPFDKEPDNDFNRYQFENDFLWSIVEKVFKKIKTIQI